MGLVLTSTEMDDTDCVGLGDIEMYDLLMIGAVKSDVVAVVTRERFLNLKDLW